MVNMQSHGVRSVVDGNKKTVAEILKPFNGEGVQLHLGIKKSSGMYVYMRDKKLPDGGTAIQVYDRHCTSDEIVDWEYIKDCVDFELVDVNSEYQIIEQRVARVAQAAA